jgi:hypothetical protein
VAAAPLVAPPTTLTDPYSWRVAELTREALTSGSGGYELLVTVSPAEGPKCARCWMHEASASSLSPLYCYYADMPSPRSYEDDGSGEGGDAQDDFLCRRCAEALKGRQ